MFLSVMSFEFEEMGDEICLDCLPVFGNSCEVRFSKHFVRYGRYPLILLM